MMPETIVTPSPTPTPIPIPVPKPVPTPLTDHGWGAPAISLYSLTLLLAALAVAYLTNNNNLLIVLAGVIAANATSVVNFYVGSSRSSQAKDATIAAQLPPAPPPTNP